EYSASGIGVWEGSADNIHSGSSATLGMVGQELLIGQTTTATEDNQAVLGFDINGWDRLYRYSGTETTPLNANNGPMDKPSIIEDWGIWDNSDQSHLKKYGVGGANGVVTNDTLYWVKATQIDESVLTELASSNSE